MTMERQGKVFLMTVLVAVLMMGLTAVSTHFLYLRESARDHEAGTAALADAVNASVLERIRLAAERVAAQDAIAATARGGLPVDNPLVLAILDTLRGSLDAEIAYVLNAHGETVASTRYDGDKHLTGNNYAFRPYFTLALAQGAAFHPALGVTTGVRGFYTGVRIPGDAALGVLAVKSGLAELDGVLAAFPGYALLLSPDGVVFAGGEAAWLYQTVLPLDSAVRAGLIESRQFGTHPLLPLPHRFGQVEAQVNGKRLAVARHPVQIVEVDGRRWEVLTLRDPMLDYPYAWLTLLSLVAFMLTLGTCRLLQRRAQHLALLDELRGSNSSLAERESQLRRRVAREELLSRVSGDLLMARGDVLDATIDRALALIGHFLEADRAYVFQFATDGKHVTNSHEWCGDGITAQKANLQSMPFGDESMFSRRIRDLKTVEIADVSALGEGWETDIEVLAGQGIHSVLAIPMLSNQRLVGFIGLDAVQSRRYWSEMDVILLRIAGEAITNALERTCAERAMARDAEVLEGLTRLQREALLDSDLHRVFDRMLGLLLKASNSQYGFIGEVLSRADGRAYVKVRAITNIAWNEATLALFQKLETGDFEITNLDSLIGAAITRREPIIANHPATDPRRNGLPDGHPSLDAYLGLPLTLGDQLVGIVGVSNRPGGYDDAMIATLEPIVATCASLIVSCRLERERETSAAALRKLSLAVEQSPESVVITDTSGRIEYVNAAFERNTGYTDLEALGRNPSMLASGRTPGETYRELWSALRKGEAWSGEIVNRRKSGEEYTDAVVISPVRDETGAVTHYLSVQQDISAKKRAEAEIQRLAYYDSLTGLPNRALLLDRMAQLLAAGRRQRHQEALLLFNIDRFKTINDARGHAVGDRLLRAFSDRLGGLLRAGDTLARLTADEFALLLPDLNHYPEHASRNALLVAEKIQRDLGRPFRVDGDEFTLTVSLGITLFPEVDGEGPVDILRRADTALHRAKSAGGNQSAFFEISMGQMAQHRFNIERELRCGIAENQLRLYLQSQVDGSGRVVGAEALVRWQHPEQGLLLPGLFIAVAEESDLIVEVGAWVLGEACRILTRPDMRDCPLRLSVNLSARQFRKPGFIPWFKELLAMTGTDPHRLTLEVTESLVIDDLADVAAKMGELSQMGIHFSLDDFGTGYSSLAYLKRLPINELKIDRMFVQDAPEDPNDAALVETILAVASHLHLKVVAEGVETEAQADFLRQRADVIHQGYLYGKPEPAEDWLARWLPSVCA